MPSGAIAPQPKDLLDRRVEITGPTDRKMVINALNCGAATFMADFEDANCPTWLNMIDGQINLRDAVRRTITLEQGGKSYRLNEKTAVLLPRPRGWHLDEKHVTVDGKPVAGGIFDFALYFFHNAKELLARGSGTVLLPAEDGVAPRGAAVERHLLGFPGIFELAQGDHQGHLPHRDAGRRVRDGRIPLGAEGPFGGPQHRPLGLHLFLHQEVPQPTRISAWPTARRSR